MYFNVRSLIPKIDELRLICATNSPHIVCVVETWLGDEISDCEISITDYNVTRLDRNRHGGGIAFYIRSDLHSEIVLKQPYDLEFMLLSIVNLKFSNKIHVGLFYRPPNSPTNTLEFLYDCLQGVSVHIFSNFVLLGDFNVNLKNPSHPLFSHLCNILYSFSLTQAVQEDTYTSPQGNTSLIDLALVSETSLLSSCNVIPPLGTSDHNGIQCSFKWKTNNPLKANARKVWRYKLADFDTANNLLDSIDWDNLLSGDINQAWENWKKNFYVCHGTMHPTHIYQS